VGGGRGGGEEGEDGEDGWKPKRAMEHLFNQEYIYL